MCGGQAMEVEMLDDVRGCEQVLNLRGLPQGGPWGRVARMLMRHSTPHREAARRAGCSSRASGTRPRLTGTGPRG